MISFLNDNYYHDPLTTSLKWLSSALKQMIRLWVVIFSGLF
nr:MAG TPA: hypothetical protein [Caudoviricetes sp.]